MSKDDKNSTKLLNELFSKRHFDHNGKKYDIELLSTVQLLRMSLAKLDDAMENEDFEMQYLIGKEIVNIGETLNRYLSKMKDDRLL